MLRSQIYLSEAHLGQLARHTSVSQQAMRRQVFAAWSANEAGPTLNALRAEERSGQRGLGCRVACGRA